MATRAAITFIQSSKNPPTLHIQCRVKPGVSAQREGIAAVLDDAVELGVSAPAKDGEANKAVLEVLSEAMDVPKSKLQIVRGLKSKDKTVAVMLDGKLGWTKGKNEEEYISALKERLIGRTA